MSTEPERARHQLEVGLVTYEDALSTVGAAQIDLRWFEVRVRGSQRIFLQTDAEGGRLFQSLESESRSIGAEIARYIVTPGGQYGRLGVEVLQFPPRQSRWFKISLSSGVNASASLPWAFRLSATHFISMTGGQGAVTHFSSDTVREFSLGGRTSLGVGGTFTWLSRSRALSGTGVFEKTLFSIAPMLSYRGHLGRISVSVPLRIWVDLELAADRIVAEPSEFAVPTIAATWTLPL